jgi:uncharacterized lipoprotein YmbA
MRRLASAFRPSASRFRLLACGVCLLVSACSLPLPQAQPDQTRYFVLQPGVKAPGEAAAPSPVPVIRIESVVVPAYLLDRPLAVRRGPNEIRYLDAARWAEPLDQGIARNLLLGLGAFPGITVISRRQAAEKWDYILKVQVVACEGSEGRDVSFAANWTLVPAPGSSGLEKTGTFAGQNLTWDGSSPASLAAALSEGVTQLCQALADAVKPRP